MQVESSNNRPWSRLHDQVSTTYTTTIDQLGGNRIFAMAFDQKRSASYDQTLRLRVARGLRANGRATHVVIKLEASDTYTVETRRQTPAGGIVIETTSDVYADSLRDVVERMTGLRMSL